MAKQTMEQFQKKIHRWIRQFPDAVEKAFENFRPLLIKDVQRNYLSGQVLGVITGRLRASIEGIISKAPNVNLRIGTAVKSKKGFGYGAYWFYKGRDFLRPSIRNNLKNIERMILDEIMKRYGKVA